VRRSSTARSSTSTPIVPLEPVAETG
jgi:hypothetical protein